MGKNRSEAKKSRNIVSFKATKQEYALIGQIVDRAKNLAAKLDSCGRIDTLSLTMDLTACHANGMRLNLPALLATDDFNFAHDVFGIHRHMDRETGQLGNCFVPRFALP